MMSTTYGVNIKAQLRADLRELMLRPIPQHVRNGSVQETQMYLDAVRGADKVHKNTRATTASLREAVAAMRRVHQARGE